MTRRARMLAIGLPAALLSVLALGSAAQEERGRLTVEVCRHRGADGGASRKVDLGAPERERARAEHAFRAGLARLGRQAAPTTDGSFDSGLPGCRLSGTEERVLTRPLPEVFRDRTLYFVRLGKGGKAPRGFLPSSANNAHVFIVAYSSLADVGEYARRSGARVSVGTAELAAKLGVRCASSGVEISPDGKSIRISEALP